MLVSIELAHFLLTRDHAVLLAGLTFLAICRPSDRTVASVVVVVVVGIYNRSQIRTSKCIYLIFGVSIGLDFG